MRTAKRYFIKPYLPVLVSGLQTLSYRTSIVDRGDGLLYRLGEGKVGVIGIGVYSSPINDHARPLIYRWHVDHYTVRIPTRALQELGFARPCGGWRYWGCRYWQRTNEHEKLELSCLPAELAVIAEWLPSWIYARDTAVPRPDAPVPMSRPGEIRDYAWTRDGEELMDAWNRYAEERRRTRACRNAHYAMLDRAIAVAESGKAKVEA